MAGNLDFRIFQDPIDELTMQHGQLFVQTGSFPRWRITTLRK
jgi:hypothetical protein